MGWESAPRRSVPVSTRPALGDAGRDRSDVQTAKGIPDLVRGMSLDGGKRREKGGGKRGRSSFRPVPRLGSTGSSVNWIRAASPFLALLHGPHSRRSPLLPVPKT